MRIVKFEGASMRETLAKVKAELGDQAMVVSTRQIRRGLIGSAYEIAAAVEQDDGPVTPAATPPPRPVPRPTLDDGEVERVVAPLRAELRSLRAMMRARADERPLPSPDLREELAALRRAVEQLRPPPPATATTATTAAVARPEPARTEPALVSRSQAGVVMLVGPTGVGKTTTIAKIAARAALIDARRVAIVTLDNYRVGGVDQVRTYADLIGVPLSVLDDPGQLAEHLAERADYDLVLVDTAGKSPRDRAALSALAGGLAAAPQVEVHLTVAAGTATAAIDELARRFAPLAPRRLLFTKLDECDRIPELTAAPVRLGLPVTWLATGQAVPEDLEEATLSRMQELARRGLARDQEAA